MAAIISTRVKPAWRANGPLFPSAGFIGTVREDTLGKMMGPERFAEMLAEKGQGRDEMLLPAEIAETYFHVAHQHRSAWTHELDLRPFTDVPWWND